MNNDQIKELLLSLEVTNQDFSVTQSGKESKKINGLYKPGTFEIIIHNQNFTTENQLIYTAIHEYTHHLINCKHIEKGEKLHARSHSTEFWAKFDDLLEESNFVNSDCGQSELETILKTNLKNRMEVELSISNGKTINQAKHNSTQSKESNPIDKLSKEKNRLEKTINQLQQRLEIVMEQLSVA